MKTIIIALLTSVLLASTAAAHCQIPCGIYDDPARIVEMKAKQTVDLQQVETLNRLISELEILYFGKPVQIHSH